MNKDREIKDKDTSSSGIHTGGISYMIKPT